MSNEVLIRLKDIKDGDLISTFYTEKPSEYLKMYLLCKKEQIPLRVDNIGYNKIIKYTDDEIEGFIEDINVFFGGKESIPCIDIWIEAL